MKKLFMIAAIIIIVAVPLIILKSASFTGTDDKAITAIQSIDKNYHPWFEGVRLFRSQEIISTFFALQAAIGGSILGYYIGYSRGKRANEKKL